MDQESKTGAPAGLFHRLAALLYDILLAIAIAFVATAAMLPLTRGEAILTATQGPLGHAYHAVWLLAVFAYFGCCWTRGGQTLGMRAWRIELQTSAGLRLGWAGAAGRYLLGVAILVLAILGIWYLAAPGSALAHAGAIALLAPVVANYAWVPIDSAGRSLIDLACQSRVVQLT